uniref:Putative restriction endonuclease domain-containing protein n=1 Tax=Cyanothece sp. (strain PCC 7425 / ATCC 29141) TaxID=395961 RepID=B8HRR4_CYAP4
MTQAKPRLITLEEFLQLPETEPPSEYGDGAVTQKPMPKGKHSTLQSELCNQINQIAKAAKIAYAFPELRCTFGGKSIVPDIAVFEWSRIAFDPGGEPADDFFIAPDWIIEILSPDQSSNPVIGKILHCLQHGCQLGWLIDPGDRSILAFLPGQLPQLLIDQENVRTLERLNFSLTVEQVFSWLSLSG